MWSVIKSRVVKSNQAIRVARRKAESFVLSSVGLAISSAHTRKSLMEVISTRSSGRSKYLDTRLLDRGHARRYHRVIAPMEKRNPWMPHAKRLNAVPNPTRSGDRWCFPPYVGTTHGKTRAVKSTTRSASRARCHKNNLPPLAFSA